MEAAKNRTTLVIFLVIFLLVVGCSIWVAAPYALAVLMGAILTMISHPVYDWLRKKSWPSWAAVSLVIVGVVLLIVGPLALFVVLTVRQIITIAQTFAQSPDFSLQAITRSLQVITQKIGAWPVVRYFAPDPTEFEAHLKQSLISVAERASHDALVLATHVPEILLQLAIAMLACASFLMNGQELIRWSSDKIPLDADVRQILVRSFKDTAISIIWATVASAAVQAAIIMIGFVVLGVPLVFLAGGATFALSWIPIVGGAIAWVAGAIYLWVKGSLLKAGFMVLFAIAAGISDNFVRPLVLKGRGPSSMPPLVSIVAILGGIRLFGIAGIFVGPILAAILISLLNAWPAVGKRFELIYDDGQPPLD